VTNRKKTARGKNISKKGKIGEENNTPKGVGWMGVGRAGGIWL
jgi:hypothetical protein